MRHLSLAVVGVGFDNKKGPTRRFEIEMCKPGEEVELRHEPRNPADRNAIAVYSCRGIQIGYLRAERAPMILAAMRRSIVNAIFQQSETWGATVRAHLDGTAPILPAPVSRHRPESTVDDHCEFYPDFIPPDD